MMFDAPRLNNYLVIGRYKPSNGSSIQLFPLSINAADSTNAWLNYESECAKVGKSYFTPMIVKLVQHNMPLPELEYDLQSIGRSSFF